MALEARIDSLEAKNEFDFEARRWQRRIEALEAAEAARVAAVRDVFGTAPSFLDMRTPVVLAHTSGLVAVVKNEKKA